VRCGARCFGCKKNLQKSDIIEGKEILRPIVSMLVGLIKSVAPDRVFEEMPAYGEESVSES
jgi:hypothetical protein